MPSHSLQWSQSASIATCHGDVRAFAVNDPRAFLAQFPDGVIIDEVQRAPELPSYLQGLIDADRRPGRFILTRSQNLALLNTVSQSLAGRTAVLHLLPLAHGEVTRFERHPRTIEDVMFAGGYPAGGSCPGHVFTTRRGFRSSTDAGRMPAFPGPQTRVPRGGLRPRQRTPAQK